MSTGCPALGKGGDDPHRARANLAEARCYKLAAELANVNNTLAEKQRQHSLVSEKCEELTAQLDELKAGVAQQRVDPSRDQPSTKTDVQNTPNTQITKYELSNLYKY